ncbi:hypothetical protein M569_17485, partial [Genlisea aurea]
VGEVPSLGGDSPPQEDRLPLPHQLRAPLSPRCGSSSSETPPEKKRYNVYVHADPTARIPPPEGVFAGRIIPSRKTQRSSPTLISASRRLLATALLDDPANAYFALVSQHCIPIHSFDFLHNFLF